MNQWRLWRRLNRILYDHVRNWGQTGSLIIIKLPQICGRRNISSLVWRAILEGTILNRGRLQGALSATVLRARGSHVDINNPTIREVRTAKANYCFRWKSVTG